MDTIVAAHEINSRWAECLEDSGVKIISGCPSDREVAAIIQKHLDLEEDDTHDKQ